MKRRLVFIALAAVLGLAVTGVASAKWFNVIRGTKSADVIAGTENRDFILGFAGDDQISAAGANDVVLAGRGNDSADGGAGFDRLRGGPGDHDVAWVRSDEHDNVVNCEVVKTVVVSS